MSKSSSYYGVPPSEIVDSEGRYTYTADVGQTSFAAAYTPGYVDVFVNGSRLNENTPALDFTATNGITVVLANPCNASDEVVIVAKKRVPVVDAISTADVVALLGTKADTNGTSLEKFNVAEATEPTNALRASQKPGFPINFNGNFQIAQTGTSFISPASAAYDLDGWYGGYIAAITYTIERVTGSAVVKYARQVTITTADASVAAGDLVLEKHTIEGYDAAVLVGKDFTISFTAKFPVTGIHCVALRNSDASRSYVHEVNCLVANTWANYSFTVVGGMPAVGTFTNTGGLLIDITHMAGSNHTGTPATADTWMTGSYITTANQVNDCATVGNVWALEDFRIDLGTVKGTEWPSYQENLAKCQRYYQKSYPQPLAPGYATSSGALSITAIPNSPSRITLSTHRYIVPMRSIPSVRLYATDGTIDAVSQYNDVTTKLTFSSFNTQSEVCIADFCTVSPAATAGESYLTHYTASARL